MIDALLYTKGGIHYEVRPLTRSLKTKAAQAFARDYPELSLVQWGQDDTEYLRKCFEGCYGVFIILGFISKSKMSLRDWTRAEIDLGKRCLEAADVSYFPLAPGWT